VETHRLRLCIHSCMIFHKSKLVSYYGLCMLVYDSFYDVSSKLSLSQININPNYDFRDSFMKLV